MIVGIALTPIQWLFVFMCAALSLSVPFYIADWASGFLPDIISEPARIALNLVVVPILICLWHKHVVFTKGHESAFFIAYIWMFGCLAAVSAYLLFFHDDPMRTFNDARSITVNLAGYGVIFLAFIMWRVRTRKSFQATMRGN